MARDTWKSTRCTLTIATLLLGVLVVLVVLVSAERGDVKATRISRRRVRPTAKTTAHTRRNRPSQLHHLPQQEQEQQQEQQQQQSASQRQRQPRQRRQRQRPNSEGAVQRTPKEVAQWGACMPESCDCSCTNGPYYHDPGHTAEGLGSFLQRLRLGALLDQAGALTWLPPHGWPTHVPLENRSPLWWMNLLGFRQRAPDCNACSMYRALTLGRLQAVRPARALEKLSGRHHRELCAQMLVHRAHLNHSGSSGGTAVGSDARSPLLSGLALPPTAARRQRTVVLWEEEHVQPRNLQTPTCTIPWFEALYAKQWRVDQRLLRDGYAPLTRGRIALPPEYTGARLVIGVHFRAGDVLHDSGSPLRTVDEESVGRALDGLLAAYRVAHPLSDVQHDVHLFVVCECDTLSGLFARFPQLVHLRGGVQTVARDLDYLAHTDVLIGSQSSFIVLAATLNSRARCVVVLRDGIKFESWELGRPHQRILMHTDHSYESCVTVSA
jgi:hypothetical protein